MQQNTGYRTYAPGSENNRPTCLSIFPGLECRVKEENNHADDEYSSQNSCFRK